MAKSTFVLSGGGGGLNQFFFYRGIVQPLTKRNLKVLSIPYAAYSKESKLDTQLHLNARMSIQLESDLRVVNPHKDFDMYSAPPLPFTKESSEELLNNIRAADIIFGHGGDGDWLQAPFESWARQQEALALFENDKVLAGYSAGCNMWVDSYYSNDNDAICSGLGLLPIKTYCHYAWFKHDNLNKLIQYHPDLPVYPLSEEAYISISLEE